MKEMECSIALNVEKDVEVGAKHTKIWTSLMEVLLQIGQETKENSNYCFQGGILRIIL